MLGAWVRLMRRNINRSLIAMSTSLALIIIASFTVTLAVGTVFWVMNLSNSYKKFEVINILSMYSDPADRYNGTVLQPDGSYFNGTAFEVHIKLKNTGTATATISNIFLDSRSYDMPYGNITQTNLIDQPIPPGQILLGSITLPTNNACGWGGGSSVTVEIETAAGYKYQSVVVLL